MARDLIVDPEAKEVETKTDATEESLEDKLPEKYRGKSAAEIVRMHQESERELGRFRNEIGQLRGLTDQLLNIRKAEVEAKPKKEHAPLTTDKLLANPEEAIVEVATRIAEERTSRAEERAARLEQKLTEQEFLSKHPDFKDTATSDEFREWAQKSKYRVGLVKRAVENDLEAADELMSLYKESRPTTSKEDAEAELEERPKKEPTPAKKAATVRSGGSAASGVVPKGNGSKEILRRSDLIKLAINNPDEYDRRWPEIQQAYKERRVK